MVGERGDSPTEPGALLEAALERTEEPEARFHIRQAMQILYGEQSSTADA
ncbi:MAG: hypothetical protein V5A33_01175 [Halobacteriales archaeon]